MKKKFDFTAEMKEAQVTKSTPQNEYLEEEKRLLGINVKELAELNDNVYGLRTDLTALVDLLGIGRFIRKIQVVYYPGYAKAGCKIWQYRSWPVH